MSLSESSQLQVETPNLKAGLTEKSRQNFKSQAVLEETDPTFSSSSAREPCLLHSLCEPLPAVSYLPNAFPEASYPLGNTRPDPTAQASARLSKFYFKGITRKALATLFLLSLSLSLSLSLVKRIRTFRSRAADEIHQMQNSLKFVLETK